MGNQESFHIALASGGLEEYAIDWSREYEPEYQEFMSRDGYWDLYGPHAGAFDGDTMLTFAQVEEIIQKRHEKAISKKYRELGELSKTLNSQNMAW